MYKEIIPIIVFYPILYVYIKKNAYDDTEAYNNNCK